MFQVKRIKNLRGGEQPAASSSVPAPSLRERISHAVLGEKGSDTGPLKPEHPVARLKVLLVCYNFESYNYF